ncbi:type I-B CRISPR-associated protein Cas5b [Methanococcus aeolicus]|uniref:type I-B CRISPR-associated protein Cas5b n=1 Tax=Methanococcus aeolicus TaxID=42879 RepID=UPI0021CABB85|nr:type I-B CRISPR-associated protein Cas5b [Methanococcus aeolicus]UXM84650.1 type I-B CRISPR-associated protein Cas5b [Methanococcus aeolicus]
MKMIVFDIWGDYGHFKKIYTTTSPLSYDFPPKTSIYGILGAFLGLDKEDYLKHINKNTVKIALRIKNPIQKTNIALNLIDTKKGRVKGPGFNLINGRTQIRFEMLKNPKYRLYVHLTDKLHSELKKLLEKHKTVYTISLGLSELIANFEYIGEFEVEKKISDNEYILINSVIRRDNIINDNINLKIDGEYLFSKIPNEMDENRITTEYIDIFYERNGELIICKVKEYYHIPELKENIVLI